MGYKGREGIINEEAPRASDGEPRYYITFPGQFTQLIFKVSEFDLKK